MCAPVCACVCVCVRVCVCVCVCACACVHVLKLICSFALLHVMMNTFTVSVNRN